MSIQDRSFERFQTQKTGALLAHLALQPGRSHSREMMAETLWPEGDPTSIRNRLNQAVSSLRRQLHPPEAPGLVLVADHFSLKVSDQLVGTDVQEFIAALAAAEHSKDRADKLFHLLTAINLYQGDLLAGYFEEWVLPQRLNFSDKYAAALREVVRLYSRIGDPEMGIRYSMKLLELEPNDIRTHLDLIDLYDRADRGVSAVRQYDQMVRMLVLAGEPVPDEARLLRKRVDRSLSAASTPTLPKAATTMVQAVEPAPKAKVAFTDNLPSELTRIIGRTSELARIQKAIGGGSRVVSLTGISGMGKTRVALAAADLFKSRFERRVMVSGAGTEFFPQISTEIQKCLFGSTESDDMLQTHRAQLAALPTTLLLLDGLECGTAKVADYIADVLKVAPNLVIIVTARMPMVITGGIEIGVGPLPLPAATDGLSELALNPSVALFTERAQAVKSDFQLTGRTSSAVAKMVTELDGIPLAIELAAAWARTLSAPQISENLTQRFDFLCSSRQEIPARHRSLVAAVDESYELLTRPQRSAFERLSLIKGAYDLEFAKRVLEIDRAQMVLDGLVSSSFVTPLATARGDRYRTIPTLSEYALKVQSPETALSSSNVIVNALLGYLKENPAEIGALYPNVDFALGHLEKSGRKAEAISLAVTLGDYWHNQDHVSEGIIWLRRLLCNESAPCINAETHLAHLEWLAGEYASATVRFESILARGEETETYDARLGLSREYLRTGRLDEVEANCLKIVSGTRISRDRQTEVKALILLGNCHIDQLRIADAQLAYEQALRLARNQNFTMLHASALQGLACIAMENGQYEAASRWISDSLAVTQEIAPTWRTALVYVDQARLAVRRGQCTEAFGYLDSAIKASNGKDLVTWRITYAAALASLDFGDYRAAAQLLGFTEFQVQLVGHAAVARDLACFGDSVARCDQEFGADQTREYMLMGRNFETDTAMNLVTTPRELTFTKEATSSRRSSKIGMAA